MPQDSKRNGPTGPEAVPRPSHPADNPQEPHARATEESLRHSVETVRDAMVRLQELPCLFPVVRKALVTAEDPNTTNGVLGDVLGADPGLAARMLKLANSAYFGVQGNVSKLSIAVGLIGYSRLHMMLRHIMVAEVFELLSARGQTAFPIWRDAIAAGAACQEMADGCWVGDPEELLAVGLLHNAGELALLSQFRESYLAARCRSRKKPSGEAEHYFFGVDSGRVGGWLLQGWGFPPIFPAACRYWAEPSGCPTPEMHRPLGIIHTAVVLAKAWTANLGPSQAWGEISPTVREDLHLTEELFSEVYAKVPERVERVEEFLDAV